jgi:cell division septation protein DedD
LLEDPALSGEVAGTWLIQLGAFASAENAENLVEILAEAGFDAGIITQQVQNLGNRYLVRHGGLETQAEAEALLEKINSELGVSGYVIPPS